MAAGDVLQQRADRDGQTITMLMVRQRLAELKANPPECRCGLCAPAHNGIVGLFWAILFSLPCWLGLWAVLCFHFGLLCWG